MVKDQVGQQVDNGVARVYDDYLRLALDQDTIGDLDLCH